MVTALALCLALPLAAQQSTTAPGGTLRVLDKITGRTQDIEFRNGQTQMVGLLAVTMTECRFPSGNRTGDAYTLLTVVYNNSTDPVFRGWMIASAPALNALDHPRYDVWALRCSSE
nr:DUF2155 domain-containing protein [Octadecabacter dasysiphoniae]